MTQRNMDWLIAKLQPFADIADQYDPSEDGNREVWLDAGPDRIIRGSFKLENYRGAREAVIELKRVKEKSEPKPADVVRALMARLPEPGDRTEYGQGSASGIERAAAELDRREALADLQSPDRRGAAMRLAYELGKFAEQWEQRTVEYPGTGQSDIDVAVVLDAVAACGLAAVTADPYEICSCIDENGRTILTEGIFERWYDSATNKAIVYGDKAVVVVPYDPARPDAALRLAKNTDGEVNVCIVTITPGAAAQ